MRERSIIEEDIRELKFSKDVLTLEVLLDIRELLLMKESRETLKELRTTIG